MRISIKSLFIVTMCLVSLPLAAQEFRAINSLHVIQADENVFEVIGRPGALKEDYWCGAGDYVRRVLSVPWKTEIFVVSDISRGVTTGARSAVRFTLTPEAIGIEPYEANWIGNVLLQQGLLPPHLCPFSDRLAHGGMGTWGAGNMGQGAGRPSPILM